MLFQSECILIIKELPKYKLLLLKEKNNTISDIQKKLEIGKEKNREFLEKANYDTSLTRIKSAI
ncbi:MAG: hypothetical protein EB041_02220 [Proteobacteria bacterium]|nr:hypothetical protein [Pseudomonadota bacterium]